MSESDPAEAKRIRETNDQVWDMVLNLVNPVFFYVIFQVLIVSHLGAQPIFRRYEWWIFGGQFLGAWGLFYSTMLRDMGYRSVPGFVLALLGLIGAVSQYVVFPNGGTASDRSVVIFLLIQLVPACFLWAVVCWQWIGHKRRWLAHQEVNRK